MRRRNASWKVVELCYLYTVNNCLGSMAKTNIYHPESRASRPNEGKMPSILGRREAGVVS